MKRRFIAVRSRGRLVKVQFDCHKTKNNKGVSIECCDGSQSDKVMRRKDSHKLEGMSISCKRGQKRPQKATKKEKRMEKEKKKRNAKIKAVYRLLAFGYHYRLHGVDPLPHVHESAEHL
jgi:hypothetical protein